MVAGHMVRKVRRSEERECCDLTATYVMHLGTNMRTAKSATRSTASATAHDVAGHRQAADRGIGQTTSPALSGPLVISEEM
jgi:hypothetical protein